MIRTNLFRIVPFALLSLAACGGNDEYLADDEPTEPDAGTPGPDAEPGAAPGRIAVVGSDFTAGVFSTVDAPSLDVEAAAVAGVASADPVIRVHGDEIFIVNRFGFDNLTILDADTLALVTQISTGADSNPQDVAVVGNKLYIAALGADGVRVIDRATPTTIDSIDLSTLDDDGLPDCNSIYAIGARVFVTCGLLESFAATGPGKVVVIDTTDDSVETTFDLPTNNPTGLLELAPVGTAYAGDLLIPTTDYVSLAAGCIVRISPGASPTAACGATNEDVGGLVTKVAFSGTTTWVSAVVYGAETTGALSAIDSTGDVGAAVTDSSVVAADVEVCGDFAFVADKATTGEGVRVYQLDGESVDEVTTDVLDIGTTPLAGNGLACIPAR